MQIRTSLGILAALVLVAYLAILGYNNQPLLDQSFRVTPSLTVPLWIALIGVFLAGVLTFMISFLLRGSADLVERWRLLRGRRAGRVVDEMYNRGMEAVLEGREEKALDHFQSVLEREPEHFNALVKAGAVLRGLKRAAEAVDLHKRAHRLGEKNLEPLYELVKDYESLDQIGKAKVVLNRIIELRPRRAPSAYRKLRRYAMKEGDWARAWQLQQLIEAQMDRTPYKVEAERRYDTGIRYQLACQAAAEDRPREALNALRKITKSSPEFVPAHLMLGEVLKGQDQQEQAVQVWATGYEQTGSPVFLTTVSDHFLEQEDPEGAIHALQETVARSSKDFLPRFFLSRLYLRLEMIDEAQKELKVLKARAESSSTLHAYLGFVAERRGEFREAAAEYRRVVENLECLKLQYRCQVCDHQVPGWVDRCSLCGEWNQIVLDFGEDPSLEELGLSTGPVYSRTA